MMHAIVTVSLSSLAVDSPSSTPSRGVRFPTRTDEDDEDAADGASPSCTVAAIASTADDARRSLDGERTNGTDAHARMTTIDARERLTRAGVSTVIIDACRDDD